MNISDRGGLLGIDCHRGEREEAPRSGKGKQRKVKIKGLALSVPKAHGNTANPGFARFLCDTLERALPISDEPKHVASRETFWAQIDRAAAETADPSLGALQAFGQTVNADDRLKRRVAEQLEADRAPGARCTFAVHRDGGRRLVELAPVRAWFVSFYERVAAQRAAGGPQGLCQITGEHGPIATTHATKISGLGGMPMGVALVSK